MKTYKIELTEDDLNVLQYIIWLCSKRFIEIIDIFRSDWKGEFTYRGKRYTADDMSKLWDRIITQMIDLGIKPLVCKGGVNQ